MPDNSVHAIVTDSPYGLKFMGAKWDYDVPSVETWKEVLRVLRPGGHLLSFAGARTQHRMCVNIEDAGFQIRDMIAWIYASGFPKSLNIGKKLDEWEGWGTGLKPAMEPITLARKPLSEKTIAANVLKWGTGAINIDDCRVEAVDQEEYSKNWDRKTTTDIRGGNFVGGKPSGVELKTEAKQGRFPANLIHDGSQMVLDLFPESKGQQGNVKGTEPSTPGKNTYGKYERATAFEKRGDSGSAARFFYCSKARKAERNMGMDNTTGNHHSTVKPLNLMRYLCRLVTPPGGIVYDPYAGSGTTLIAVTMEGFHFIGSETEEDYCKIANQRLNF